MPTTEQLNTSLAGRYTVERLIGEGGMATVYLARDLRHNRRVALKVLNPDLGAVVGIERFLSEIQVTANLQHPNLLPLFDSGAADSLLFYVMPYVEGESLRARLQREKQLPLEEVVHIATAVASALDYAHRHGVIHRDLKPENILLHEGQPLVADFGIALAVSNAGGNRITQTGVSLGTPQYMSPEQATGDRVIDGRTDIYSLGAVTYEMLTGDPPHIGNTSQAVIARVLTDTPRSIRLSRPSVPEQIAITVERALEKLPADRWATAREFSEALTGARVVTRSTSAEASAAPSTGDTGGIRVGRRRVPAREAAAWSIAALAIAGAAAASLRTPPPAPENPMEFEVLIPDSIKVVGTGSAANVALSKDGSTLVFQGSRNRAPPMLFLRRLDERTVHEIAGTDEAHSPVLSADGSEVLFATATGLSSLKRVPLHGGAARTLVDSAAANGQESWSESGLIVFVLHDALWTTSVDDRRPVLLAKPDSTRAHVRYGFPDVLAGGKAALITIWKHDVDLSSASLGVISIPEGKVTELGVSGTYPRYTPAGGGYIVYATAEGWIYAVPFSPRSGRVTGAPFSVTEGLRLGGAGAAGFAVAANGTLAYVAGSTSRSERELDVVSRGGAAQPLGAKIGIYSVPRVSPDGRQIAVTLSTQSFGLYPNPDIWRFDIASKVLDRMTTDSNSNYSAWIDGGKRIAYTGLRIDSFVKARPLDASGHSDMLVHGKRFSQISAARAAKYVAFRIGAGLNPDIWIANLDSLSALRPFLTESYAETAPATSPDGKLLAYVSNRTGRSEIYVRPIAGAGADLQISQDGGTEPVWRADGRELFYRGATQLISVRFAPGPRLAVAASAPLFIDDYVRTPAAIDYDVFPDGKRFVMVRDRSPATSGLPIIVKLNWLAKARSGAAR